MIKKTKPIRNGITEMCEPLVLVAKNDMMSRKLTCDLLKSRGYRVLEVKSARRVVEAALQNNPDIVLIDFSAEDEAVRKLVKSVQKEQRLSHIPFLTVSDKDLDLNIINDFAKEMDLSLKKPASTVSIVEKIDWVLGKLKKYASR